INLRAIAIESLGGIGPAAKSAVNDLIPILKDDKAAVRWTAGAALVRIDPPSARPAVPLFVTALLGDDDKARWDAAQILAQMGEHAEEAGPAFLRIMKNKNLPDRWLGPSGLGNIGAKAVKVLPELIETLQDKDIRSEVVQVLVKLGPAAKDALPGLRAALKDDD